MGGQQKRRLVVASWPALRIAGLGALFPLDRLGGCCLLGMGSACSTTPRLGA